MLDDWTLLQQYAEGRSQGAFAELADRYVDFVFGCCRRQLRDRHLAEDVAQGVFLVLASKAGKIPRDAVLAGWLFQVSRYACANAVKLAARRRRHESAAALAAAAQAIPASESCDMEELIPLLDDAVSRLRSRDRDAILLRFFQGRSVKEIALTLAFPKKPHPSALAGQSKNSDPLLPPGE